MQKINIKTSALTGQRIVEEAAGMKNNSKGRLLQSKSKKRVKMYM